MFSSLRSGKLVLNSFRVSFALAGWNKPWNFVKSNLPLEHALRLRKGSPCGNDSPENITHIQ